MDAPSDFPVICPGCRASYRVPADMAGQPVTCQVCQTDFILPEGSVPSAPDTLLPPATAKPRGNAAGAFFKNILLVLSGAALVWSVSIVLKKPQQTTEAIDRTATDPVPASETAAPDPAVTEPIITTTRPTRSRPKTNSPPPELATAAPETVPPPPDPGAASAPPASVPASESVPVPTPEMPPPVPSEVIALPTASPQAPVEGPPVPGVAPVLPAAAVIAPNDPSQIRRNSRLTLERFLAANNMEERLALSQNPDKIRSAMEQHYRTWPAGPLPLEGIAFLTDGEVPDTQRKFHLYNVSLKDQEAPIPLAVEETKDGYRVDWPTFAESYTHSLRTFFAAPVETPGRFRVMLRRAHYFGPPVPGQDTERIAYTVEPPMRDEVFHVWVDKDSLVYKEKLATGERAGWEAESYVIVELVWKGDEKRARWVGLHRIPADSWRAE